jgi:hypoxanthine phosphoribosyltransferase
MELLYSSNEIGKKVKGLAHSISLLHRNDKTPIVMLGVLNGCFMFYSDLVKNLELDVECDFIRAKSYLSEGIQGPVKIIKEPESSLKDKHIYIVDDIFDTGNTVGVIIDHLEAKQIKTASVVTLVKRTKAPTQLYHSTDPSTTYRIYSCFQTEEWLVGYGMDDDKGHMRNYPDIYCV